MTTRGQTWQPAWQRMIELTLSMLLLASLVAFAAEKYPHGAIAEMLWTCHAASLLIIVGVVARHSYSIAAGTAFHLGVGVPSYLAHAIFEGTTALSMLVHTLAPVVGLLALRNQPWPRRAPWGALALYVTMTLLARLFTPPQLNINVAFGPWQPVENLLPTPALSWIANVLFMLGLVFIVSHLVYLMKRQKGTTGGN